MDKTTALRVVRDTFKASFDRSRYRNFINELCNGFNEGKAQTMRVPDAFVLHIKSCWRLGTFESAEGEFADVLVVNLTESYKLERTRTALRDFVAHKLKRGDGEDNSYKEAALVAFVAPDLQSWRFSFVRMEYATKRDPKTGKIKPEERLTPARRYSYLVGTDEECHTAQTRFLALLQDTTNSPTLSQIEEAFSVEAVTKEFFQEYARLFEATEAALAAVVKRDKAVRDDFAAKGVSTVDFAKKLLGQIVFLYFIQKKGWLGVPKGGKWGDGQRNFLRQLANRAAAEKQCLFNALLEPLFYDTLATDRGHDAWCKTLACRIPFLNGGLFEPLAGYEWATTQITLPNTIFTNKVQTTAGDVGDGILDVFDRYNFTVNESEPLEKEVAIDPEMLGKVFENLIEENRRKGLGAFYTPREIVHYMCQESLINYLDTALNHPTTPIGAVAPQPEKQPALFVDSAEKPKARPAQQEFTEVQHRVLVARKDLEEWISQSDQFAHYAAAIAAGTKGDHYLKPPDSIRTFAQEIDVLLRDITVCDPAIGSGAFPVGMMTEIVRARMALTPYFTDVVERSAYNFKRHAIHNSIYGVDIDPGAVEIAKLRLWLSLVVDEEDVGQIRPLPNLDYKVVVGNSLLGFPFKSQRIQRIEKLKDQYFDETDHDKKQRLKHEIDEELSQAFANSKKTLGYEVSFDFGMYFSEVFRAKQGFDVVIANPPYISAVEFAARYPDSLRKQLNNKFETAKGTYDIYVLFIEEGIRLLAKGGVLAFINPNKYLSAKYAVALREHILKNASLLRLVDVSGILVFSEAAVYPVVSVMQKGVPGVYRVNLSMPLVRKTQAFEIRNFTSHSISSELLRCLPENIWGFLLSNQIDLLLKLIADTQNLSEIAGINASSTAGEADAYGTHIQTRELKGSKKLVNTGTIERFFTLWGVAKLTHAGEKYLTPYLPFDLAGVSERRRQLYSSPKLIFAKMAKTCEAFFDREGEYASLNTNFLYGVKDGVSIEFCAGYCNSKLFMFFYDQFFGALRMSGGYFQFQAPQLRVMPFKMPDKASDKKCSALVDRILAAKARDASADVSALEREIDELVYALYGLTPEEIQLVEG